VRQLRAAAAEVRQHQSQQRGRAAQLSGLPPELADSSVLASLATGVEGQQRGGLSFARLGEWASLEAFHQVRGTGCGCCWGQGQPHIGRAHWVRRCGEARGARVWTPVGILLTQYPTLFHLSRQCFTSRCSSVCGFTNSLMAAAAPAPLIHHSWLLLRVVACGAACRCPGTALMVADGCYLPAG